MIEKKEKEKAPFPWRGFALGALFTVFSVIFSAVACGWKTWYPQAAPYTWDERMSYFNSWWVFIAIFTIVLPLQTRLSIKLGRKVGLTNSEIAVMYAMYVVGFSAQAMWINQACPLSWWIPAYSKDLLAQGLPSFTMLPESAITAISLGGPFVLSDWLIPMLYHGTFIFLQCSIAYFLAVLWRKPWLETENLPYPMFTAPVYELVNLSREREVDGRPSILASKPFWIGFILAWVMCVWELLNVATNNTIFYWYPFYNSGAPTPMPNLSLIQQTKGLLTITISHPVLFFALYFLPLDVLLSILVGYFVFMVLKPSIGISLGIFPDVSSSTGSLWNNNMYVWFPQNMYLAWGMMMGFGVWTIFRHREHVKNLFLSLVGKQKYDEPAMPYRWAMIGLIVTSVLWTAMWLMLGGWPWLTIVMVSWIIFGWFFAEQRFTGEGFTGAFMWGWYCTDGLASMFVQPETPTAAVMYVYGAGVMESTSLTRFHIAPIGAFKVSNMIGGNDRHVFIAIFIAALITVPVLLWFNAIYLGFLERVELVGAGPTGSVAQSWYIGTPTQRWHPETYVLGILFSFALLWLKSKFVWFPLNAAGILIGMGPGNMFKFWRWFAVLIVWIWKWLTWKVGGSTLNRKMTHLCLGWLGGYMIIVMLTWPIGYFLVGMEELRKWAVTAMWHPPA